MNDDKLELITYITETRYHPETKLPVFRLTKLNGLLQAPPDGEPSEIGYDELGRERYLKWHDKGKLHREGASAYITLNPVNGIHRSEFFMEYGEQIDRQKGPYWIIRNPNTGEVERQVLKGDPSFPEEENNSTLEL